MPMSPDFFNPLPLHRFVILLANAKTRLIARKDSQDAERENRIRQ
jgi:hypothetical protein